MIRGKEVVRSREINVEKRLDWRCKRLHWFACHMQGA